MLALLKSKSGVIEEVLWLPEIRANHIGNKTDITREFSHTRLVCPWTLEPLEGEVHEDAGDLKKSRGGLIKRLHPEGNSEGMSYFDRIAAETEDPWMPSVWALHTWANYTLWLSRCNGERNMRLTMEKLSTTAGFKAWLHNDRFLPIANRFLPLEPYRESLKSLATKGVPTTASHAALQEMEFSIAPQLVKTRLGNKPAYMIVEKTQDPEKDLRSAVYQRASNNTGETGFPLLLLAEEIPASVSHVKYIPLEGISGEGRKNQDLVEYEPEDTKSRIKKRKDAKKAEAEEKIRTLPYSRIWTEISALKAWNPAGNLYAGKGNVSEDTWFPGKGNPDAKAWVIGLFPSGAEMKSRPPQILVGPSGEELDYQIDLAGMNPETDVYVDNMLRTYFPVKTKPSREHKLAQLWLLKAMIIKHKPERIIGLGAEAFQALAGDISFTENRGQWMEASVDIDPAIAQKIGLEGTSHSFMVAGTYHPAYCLKPENRHTLTSLREDMTTLLKGGEAERQPYPLVKRVDITNVNELSEFTRLIHKRCTTEGLTYRISIDTESWNLDHTFDRPVSIQTAVRFIKDGKNLEDKEGILTGCMIYWQNPDPEIRDYSTFKRNVSQELELQLGDMAMFAKAAPQSEEGGIVHKKRAKQIFVVWDENSRFKADRIQEKKKCDAVIFDMSAGKRNLRENDPMAALCYQSLFTSPLCEKVVMTNTNFDRIRLERKFGADFAFRPDFIADTIIGEHVVNENNSERGLKSSIKRWLGWASYERELTRFKENYKLDKVVRQIPEQYPKSPWALLPWSVVGPYSVLDAVGALLVYERHLIEIEKQVEELQDNRKENNLFHAFNISCGALDGIYEMQEMGMPVGKKGMKNLEALEEFYGRHEKKMITGFQESVFRLTGFKNPNPKSPEELGYILFNDDSPLTRLGMRPWKESGKNGRLWDEIPREEQANCNPSTDAESLEILAANCPDPNIQEMLLGLSDAKTILTLRQNFIVSEEAAKKGKGIRGNINPRTLSLNTVYYPTLDTNRCRSIPNLSTFPNNEVSDVLKITGEKPPCAIRDVVQAPDGTYLLSRDWSTAEVLTLGFLSEDPNMLATIAEMKNGQDFHARLAYQAFQQIQNLIKWMEHNPIVNEDMIKAAVNGPDLQEISRKLWKAHWERGGGPMTDGQKHQFIKNAFEDLRQNIKPVTFGVPYGRTAPQIQKQLNREYFIKDIRDSDGNLVQVSLADAEAMVEGYKSEFAVAWEYLLEQAVIAEKRGYLEDRWGYIRHFPPGMKKGDLERKAYNYQIQHGVAVLMNQAMAHWTKERRRQKLRSYQFYTLYDAIGWVIPEDELQQTWDTSIQIMTAQRPIAPTGIAAKWLIPTDGKLSKCWSGEDKVKPESLGINKRDEWNITGL